MSLCCYLVILGLISDESYGRVFEGKPMRDVTVPAVAATPPHFFTLEFVLVWHFAPGASVCHTHACSLITGRVVAFDGGILGLCSHVLLFLMVAYHRDAHMHVLALLGLCSHVFFLSHISQPLITVLSSCHILQ